jgi:predicted ATPase
MTPPARYVVAVTADGTPELFGPFDSANAAWRFANKVRNTRRADARMPAVTVEPVHPGRLAAVRL